MSAIQLQRPHALGLPTARRVARHWAERMVERYGMQCRYEEDAPGPAQGDLLHFNGSGVAGTLQVAPDGFALEAQLGLLASMFRDRIATEAGLALDAMVLDGAPAAAAPDTPA